MTCTEVLSRLNAYHDSELMREEAVAVERHIESCPTCQARAQEIAVLSQSLHRLVPPYELRVGARESLSHPPVLRPQRSFDWRSFSMGSGLGIAAAALLFLLWPRADRSLTSELIGDHVRSLMPGHLIDVASSDRHTVKPWFLGKIDFAPTVPDLKSYGSPLLGGRLEYVTGHTVAALVYGHGKHIVNVFVMPQISGQNAQTNLNGYHTVHWEISGLGYWAVSDISEADLAQFERSFEAVASRS